ncbi:mRNA turnover protein 4 homolog [Thrips palmi]|uniref:Ribosome assembly factor mrt4 n=1 Tax=Thrips palmi TaxID=161013 RepID=A0A6P9A7K3_THRPL|nr:mRNA turnover protein 4 homolog [Thrips palmi]
MPKSKRDVKISLTKTKPKDLQFKQQKIEELRQCVEQYERIFVFSVENMRNTKLKDLRNDWRDDSRFYFGKNKIMQLGFGRNKADELYPNLHKLSKRLVSQCGLLFTNKSKHEIVDFFKNFREPDFARSGFVATEDVVLPAGPLEEFSFAMEPQLRQWGMPTSLQRGVVTLLQDYQLCKKGSVLTPEKARILKLLGRTMAEFHVTLKCMWEKSTGKLQRFESKKASIGGEDDFSLRMEADEKENDAEGDDDNRMDDSNID